MNVCQTAIDILCVAGVEVKVRLRSRSDSRSKSGDAECSTRVTVDVGYGGAFYAIVDAAQLGLDLTTSRTAEVVDAAHSVTGLRHHRHRHRHHSGADPEICERGPIPPVPFVSPSYLPFLFSLPLTLRSRAP